MFTEVKASRLTCWADTARYEYNTLVVLSLFGAGNVVRGVSAHLSGKNHIDVQGYEDYLRLADTTYVRAHQSLGEDQLHLVLCDRRATLTGSSWDSTIYHVAPDEAQARATWMPRFAQKCRVPLRPSWGPKLWDAGVAAELIQELDGFGMRCYNISSAETKWHELVSALVREGKLT